MNYVSTRGYPRSFSAAEAIVRGLAPDGGLFMPDALPRFTPDELNNMEQQDYAEVAASVMARFLPDYTPEELSRFTREAYSRFGADAAPLVDIGEKRFVLELYHGPTSAFKDFALQMLPRLLAAGARKTGVSERIAILVATSGDTGKAALDGFADVEGTAIQVFYPAGGVSDIQQLQMTTQRGANVRVTAVRGNFDDAQRGVKAIFSDNALAERLRAGNIRLSSANSINWGRLVPQVAYWFYAYSRLVRRGVLSRGGKMDVCVPTGNFGDIFSAYLAKRSGLPIDRFICASNSNNVLYDFINTGVYDKNRDFKMTVSPSMDILISSNLERLLWLLAPESVPQLMRSLAETGRFALDNSALSALKAEFSAEWCSEEDTLKEIADAYKGGYLCDTHTAVALHAVKRAEKPTVVASTASPFKFPAAVLTALGLSPDGTGRELLDRLSNETGQPIPAGLAALDPKDARFFDTVEPDEMERAVTEFLL